MSEDIEYQALLVDTSIYDGNGLRLEKGLLGKLSQFERSPVDFLMPDVIFGEVKTHLEQKIKALRSSLEKAINDAGEHIFLDGDTLDKAKLLLFDDKEANDLAERRLNQFIENTGATILECGKHIDISSLLKKYFSNEAPFSETGKKKNEFPDAIVLMAVDEWAKNNKKSVLAVSTDDDWVRYCKTSANIKCIAELSEGLAIFNKANIPYAFISKLEAALDNQTAQQFLNRIAEKLEVELDGFTPDQDAESSLCWEPEGSNGWFKKFDLISNQFQIIEISDEYIVIECEATITVEAEGEFSLSAYDSIDHDYVPINSVVANVEENFDSEILITIAGNFEGNIEDLNIEQVEIISPIKCIHFGTLEPDFSGYD